ALRLAKDSYIKLGRFENLNFNKGFTIGFWLNPERYLKYTYNEGERKILLSNGKVEVGIEQAWGQIAFTPENKETHAFLNYAAMAMNMYNLHFMTFTNDEFPTMSTYVNDYTTPRATKTATNWGVGLLSDGDLYVGIPNATDTKYTMPHGIGGIMIWDKVLTDDERAAIFNGCTLLEG
ncbi:MAG: hypothetical protein WBJ37_03795, partial [Bacteroidales bacterium]